RPQAGRSLSLAFGRLASFSQPALEGVRGGGASTNHYLFEEGKVLLDVHIEASGANAMASASGQIFSTDRDERGYEHKPVALMRGQTKVASAVTDQFGAFQLEYMPQ